MREYKLTVGLEVHAELNTKTKMFCASKNDPDEKNPNTNICPVCLGYPGSLPTINKDAVRHVLRLGLVVGGELADYTEFDRKNYFYPDIPKGYQISQHKHPLVRGGELSGVTLTRIHLEEDTARSSHGDSESLVDFNRAGVPLMELVTEPVIHSPLEAGNFARELQLTLRYLGMSEANMEKGEMRVEANVSVSADSSLGTKVEVKNLNSFKVVEKAIAFEMQRQIEIIERGEKVVQETRGWDDNAGKTFSQRAKEDSHDYRYFPDPDLPKIFVSEVPEFSQEELVKSLPEMPKEKRERLKNDFGLKELDVEIYTRDKEMGAFFEEVASELGGDKDLVSVASNYIISDLKKLIPVKDFSKVIKMISSGELSSRGAKDILKILETEGGDPRVVAEKNNLLQKSNVEELKTMAEKIISENEKVVDEYRKGKLASIEFLVGQGMKVSKGSANPKVLKEIFEGLLA